MDTLTKILGGIMIVVIFVVILILKPPVGMAVKETLVPTAPMDSIFPAILTLLGGTVGGYITFAGAHRLIDAGITKEENLKEINKSSVMGMIIATIVRIFLFLAVLGVVVKGVTLDSANPAADAFKQGAGEIGYRFAGLVLLCAAIRRCAPEKVIYPPTVPPKSVRIAGIRFVAPASGTNVFFNALPTVGFTTMITTKITIIIMAPSTLVIVSMALLAFFSTNTRIAKRPASM